jgi:hypothetical protein
VVLVAGAGALGWLVWHGQFAASEQLFGMQTKSEEAAYCLAVAERISEITRGQARAELEAHISEQILFWRGRAIGAGARGRMALARDSGAPGVNEQAHLHLAVQDCGNRAVALYGHRFTLLD